MSQPRSLLGFALCHLLSVFLSLSFSNNGSTLPFLHPRCTSDPLFHSKTPLVQDFKEQPTVNQDLLSLLFLLRHALLSCWGALEAFARLSISCNLCDSVWLYESDYPGGTTYSGCGSDLCPWMKADQICLSGLYHREYQHCRLRHVDGVAHILHNICLMELFGLLCAWKMAGARYLCACHGTDPHW